MSAKQPAFPDALKDGMELRDYFAAKALQALIGKLPLIANAANSTDNAQVVSEEMYDEMLKGTVKGAYCYADFMLAERVK